MRTKIIIILFLFVVLIGCGNKTTNSSSSNTDINSSSSINIDSNKSEDQHSENIYKVKLGNRFISILIKEKECSIPIILFNMHENEITAYKAGQKLFDKYGGKLVKLIDKGNRNITFTMDKQNYTFDPNRIFTENGRRKTLAKLSKANNSAESELEIFAKSIIDSIEISKDKIIIALHNNTHGDYTIRSYLKNGVEAINASDIHANEKISGDDFFVVTNKQTFDALKSNDMNVVLQNNENAVDDGSLSIYCANNGIDYINVEALSDHLEYQHKMLEVLFKELENIYIEKKEDRKF